MNEHVTFAPHYNFNHYAGITDLRTGLQYRWLETTKTHYLFALKPFEPDLSSRIQKADPVSISHHQFDQDLTAGLIEIDQHAFANQRPQIKSMLKDQGLDSFPEHKAFKALFYEDLFKAFLKRKSADRRSVSLSEPTLKRVIPELAAEIAPLWKKKKMRTGPMVGTEMGLPGPRHFRRLFHLYVNSGYKAVAVIDRSGGPKTRKSRSSEDDQTLRLEFAMKYANFSKPKKSEVYKALVAHIVDKNPERTQNGLPPYVKPSRKSFEKLIDSLDKYVVTYHREGPEKAKVLFGITAQGMEVERPGERVEIDEWKVDLMSLLVWLKVAKQLTPKERSVVESTRLWVTVAIDCATRCILAMRFSLKDPTAESSMAALEMVLMDKSNISANAGARLPWNQFCVPESVVTDTGNAFIAPRFRTALADLGVEHMFPPPGEAKLRPHIESFFKTCKGFLAWYGGRTFSDYIEKGEYDPKANAVVAVDQLNRDFVRAIVDDYHGRPHVGLAGETPYAAWLRLSAEYGVLPIESTHKRRRVFGIRCNRTIKDKGVRILGLHYNSVQLQKHRMKVGSVKVDVRFDRFDIDTVTVMIDGRPLHVKNRFGLPQGVSVWEWIGAVKELSAIHAENAELTRDAMMDAINARRESGEAASAMAEIGTNIVTTRHVDALEKKLFRLIQLREQTDLEQRGLSPLTIAADPLSFGHDLLGGTPTEEYIEYEKQKKNSKKGAKAKETENRDDDYDDFVGDVDGGFGDAKDVIFERKV